MKTIFIALGAIAVAGAAQASPCGDRVAALEQRYNQTHEGGVSGAGPSLGQSSALAGTGAESTGAKLHHQPTEGSVENAAKRADSPSVERDAKFQVAIEEARAAADSGDTASCERSAAAAERLMTP